MKTHLAVAFVLIGFAAVTGQVILLRELLVVFHGNEVSTAVVLACWLIWTSAGSVVMGKFADRISDGRRLFAVCQILVSLLLPASILLARATNPLWGLPVGEIVDFGKMALISFTTVAPFCFLAGVLFVLGCGIYGSIGGERAVSVGKVYLLEAFGAGAGGVFFYFLFVRHLNHLQAAAIVSCLLALSSMALLQKLSERKAGRLCIRIGSVVLLGAALFVIWTGPRLDRATRGWGYRGYELVRSEETPYGNLSVVTGGEQFSLFENGLWMFTWPDVRSAEESVHFAMLEHPEPRKILLIGGGVSGSLAQILKHPAVISVDYVELDPEVIDISIKTLPKEASAALDDPRVRVLHGDGRKFVKRSETRYDVVIVNLPDPLTAQLNRYYTAEFFCEAEKALEPGGVFAVSLTSSENVIGPTLAQLLGSLKRTMSEVFAEVVVFPGETARFFGSMQKGFLTTDPQELVRRIQQRSLDLLFVRDYYLLFDLSEMRFAFLNEAVERAGETRINRDLKPSCYYYDLVHWSAQYTPFLKTVFLTVGRVDIYWLLFFSLLSTLVIAGFSAAKRDRKIGPPLLCACYAVGCSEMVFSVLIIVAFQILYGYLYEKIALLIAAYMIGLIVGSGHIVRVMEKVKRPLFILVAVQGAVGAYALVLLGVIVWGRGIESASAAAAILEKGFPVLALAAGYLGGLHFPLVNRVYPCDREEVGKTAGMVYGTDLLGSSVGALAAGFVLIPVLGVAGTLYFVAGFNLFALLPLLPFLQMKKETA